MRAACGSCGKQRLLRHDGLKRSAAVIASGGDAIQTKAATTQTGLLRRFARANAEQFARPRDDTPSNSVERQTASASSPYPCR
jgi:hypothetical protein